MTIQEIKDHPWLAHESAERLETLKPLLPHAAALSRSERGKAAAKALRLFMRDHLDRLDSNNRTAVTTLMAAHLAGMPDSVQMLLEILDRPEL